MLTILALVQLTVSAASDGATRDPIVTDRPNVAESSVTVPAQSLQVETGTEFGSDEINDIDSTSFGIPTKIRYGLIDDLEIHVEGTIINRFSADLPEGSRSETGLADFELGGKFHILDANGAVPSLGILAAVTIPVGDDDVSTGPSVIRPTVAADWDLLPALSFSGNVGFTIHIEDRDFVDDTFRFAGSLGIHPDVFPVGLGLFAELFGAVALSGDSDEAIGADAGALYVVNDDFQLDAYVRFGLTDAATDLVAGGGGSFRF
ncbi:MAG: transporter [Myxococcota bacterium]